MPFTTEIETTTLFGLILIVHFLIIETLKVFHISVYDE